jgi:hypothetical protein
MSSNEFVSSFTIVLIPSFLTLSNLLPYLNSQTAKPYTATILNHR